MKYRVFILILINMLFGGARGQEMWGVVNGNYSGINAVQINPARVMHSKLYLDVNIAGADLFFENNAFYIHREDYKPFSFLRSGDNLPRYGKDELPFDYYRNTNRKNLHVSATVLGPAFSIARRDDAFGFRTAFRSVISARDIPYEIIPFSYEGLNYDPLHNINFNNDDLGINGLAWMEFGFTYARTLYRRGPNHLTGGANARLLLGMAGTYLDLENLDYIVNNDSTLNLRNVRGEFAYSSSTGNSPVNGLGMAVDLGIVFEKKTWGYSSFRANKLCKQPYEDYRYRLGLSLIDLGYINFKRDASRHAYDDVGIFWQQVDTVNFRDIDSFVSMLSNELYGSPGASLRSERMRVLLPAALSIQWDQHFYRQWYLNATVIQPLNLGKEYIYRPAQISVSPRYETRMLEFNMPVSLYDYRYPRVGLSARFWFFTIGTDKLLGFFNITDFTGMDLYVAVKLNFIKGKCRSSGVRCEYQRD